MIVHMSLHLKIEQYYQYSVRKTRLNRVPKRGWRL